jgi:hypothetical protein
MSRPPRLLPRIQPDDLRDHVDADVVDRVWERLEPELPSSRRAAFKPGQRASALALLAAAVLGAFAIGVGVGRGSHAPAPLVAAAPSSDQETEADVLAAGDEARSFPLPGGGRLTLSPGATVELQRAGNDLTLKLVQGDAKLETVQANAAMLVGDARLNTQAGSTVQVSRRVDNLSVDVKRGTASVDSPSVQQRLAPGESVSVPLHRAPSTQPTGAVAAASRPHVHHAADTADGAAPPAGHAAAAVAAVDPAVSDKEAIDRVQHAPGGFSGAVKQAANASELMRLYDLAKLAKEGGAASSALRRLADDFGGEHYGVLASHRLCQELGDAPNARKYCERDRQSPLFDAEAEACRQLRAAARSGHKDEAVRVAEEYAKAHADGGQCRDEAQRILAGGGGDDADAPAPSISAAPPSSAPADSAAKPDPKAPPPKP